MAIVQTALLSERWLDEVLVYAVTANVGADAVTEYALPAGLGDVAIMEILFQDANIATMVTLGLDVGVSARMLSGATLGAVDFVGVGRLYRTQANYVHAVINPDPLVLWRQSEYCQLFVPELDTNATPTDDQTVYFKCVRVRPIETTAPGPVRLVR